MTENDTDREPQSLVPTSLVEIKDVLGLSAVGVRIVDKISNAIGTVYRPRAIRNEAEAKGHEIEVLGKARARDRLVQAEAELSIIERAKVRVDHRELIRQRNIETVAEAALEFAAVEEEHGANPEAPPEDIDPDWFGRFINKAQDVHGEQMQQVWGRVLAKEARKPGRFSLKSLEVLSNMTGDDAELFQKFCHLCFNPGYVFKIGSADDLTKYGVSYYDIMKLRANELVHEADSLTIEYDAPEKALSLNFNGVDVLLSHPEKTMFVFKHWPLTPTGIELKTLTDQNPNFKYMRDFKIELEKDGYNMQVLKPRKS
jgi:hypothetical protein